MSDDPENLLSPRSLALMNLRVLTDRIEECTHLPNDLRIRIENKLLNGKLLVVSVEVTDAKGSEKT